MATTKVINDLIDLNQTGNTQALKGCVGTTAQQPDNYISIDFLVVGAGGGTYGYDSPGGGGGGGVRTSFGSNSGGGSSAETSASISPGRNYTVTVGEGVIKSNGETSIFGNITSSGGGYGGAYDGSSTIKTGGNGGSGGGGTGGGSFAAGSGTTNQGFAGGAGSPTAPAYPGGGGGGSGGAGQAAPSGSVLGNGGIGTIVNILPHGNASTINVGEVSGTDVYYGGGAGGNSTISASGGTGGLGGGADAPNNASVVNGTVNTGGGGAGAIYASSTYAKGGSGVVILRYSSSYTLSKTGTLVEAAGSPFTEGSDYISVFTSGTGTVSFSGSFLSDIAQEGSLRTNTDLSSASSTSAMQFYKSTGNPFTSGWVTLTNVEPPSAIKANLLYEVKAGSLTDGSNTGPITWSDESGNGNDWLLGKAVMVGASAVNTFTVNKSDNYFECASGSLTSGATGTGVETVSAIDLTNDCTVEMWLYLTAYQTYTGGFVTYDYYGTKNGMYGTLTMPSTYYQSLTVYSGNVAQATASSNYATLLNTWYQHVFTIDDTNNEIKFYKNGVLQSTYSSAFSYNSANDIAAVGYPDYGSSQPFAGRIGILRGYTAVLTPAEVLHNFDNDKASYGL